MSSLFLVVSDDGLVEHEVTTSDVAEVLRLIDALDGRKRTLVTTYLGDGHIAVGGDAVSGLVAYATLNGETFHQLRSATTSADDEVAVVAGGQSGNYPRRLVVDAQAAKAAVRLFVLHGGLDPAQEWEVS